MKKYLKFLCTIVLICPLILTACSSGGRADAEYEGKYISVAAESMGIKLTGEEIQGFVIELESGGKGKMSVYEDTDSIKWTNDDTSITISAGGEDIIGTIGKDTITFDNIFDEGLKLVFAKEGSEAAKPENNMPETDKNMLGVWKSTGVTDILGDPVEGYKGDDVTVEFFGDYTANVKIMDISLEKQTWWTLGEWGYIDNEDYDISWEISDNGIILNYYVSDEEGYLIYTCVKQK